MKRIVLLLVVLAAFTISCSGSGGYGGSADVPPTTCGTIVKGKYKNPVSDKDGEVVLLVTATKSNFLTVQNEKGEEFGIRLLGITDEPRSRLFAAKSIISSFAYDGLLFVPAGCNDPLAGNAQKGSVFNRAGENLAEVLVGNAVATANPTDICGGDRIGQCLLTISDINPINSGPLSSFLWKPQADSDGNLAVHTGPYGTTVIINGVTGVNQGPGNGYGSLARFPRPGCSYAGAQIQVLDSQGLPYTVGGKTTFSVPNPCGRFCATDGNNPVVCSRN